MTRQDLLPRFKKFGREIMKLVRELPNERVANAIGNQLIRSGTSVYMNYRGAKRARSTAAFIHKMSIVEEEADESYAWIELLIEDEIVSEKRALALKDEAYQITAITIASIKTARKKNN